MKTLKKILIVLLILIAIPFIVALFVSKEFKVEKEIVIDKPESEVFDYVKYIRNQDNYGVWQLSDPEAKITEEGTDGTVGYTYSWDGKKVGKGTQTITHIVENEKLETELDFGFGNPSQSYILTEEVAPNQTKVVWGISGKAPYPWNLMNLFYDMGKDFEGGLQNLKKILETQESPAGGKAALLNYYQQTFDNLKKSVSGLSKAQMHFKPNAKAWSVSQCLEHIIISEKMFFGMLKESMDKPANPERRAEIKHADQAIIAMVTDRSEKYKASEELTGQGTYDDAETALQKLEKQRTEFLSFIHKTPLEDLRNRVNDSPVGATDLYQSLLFFAGHTARHTLQIDEVKAGKGFPEN